MNKKPSSSAASATGPLVPQRGGRAYLAAEFTVLFVVVPVLLFVFREGFATRIIPTLVLLALGCGCLLWLDPAFDRRTLWNTIDFGPHLRRTLRTFALGAAGLGLLVVLPRPDLLFAFPRENPGLWAMVMVLYPVFSVYPQEVLFRTFLFHRYRALFPTDTARIVASGLAFGLAHLFFANWLAPVLTTLGGLLFARTYARSRSTLQASLDHALWGDFIFTIDLGWYFYGGSIVAG